MTREIAQVVYATDDTYAPHAAASIRSLIAHQDAPVSVRVLACGLAPRSKQTIRQHADVESTGASIAFIDVPLDLLRFFALEPEKENWVKHVSAATYARLYSDVFFPDLDRLLYLDADTIVLADLSELWRTDLQGRVVGAIRDPGSRRWDTRTASKIWIAPKEALVTPISTPASSSSTWRWRDA